MIKLSFNQKSASSQPPSKWKLFSKKRAADIIFFAHFFLLSLPALAIPDPDVDPTLGELRLRFIHETSAQSIDKDKFILEVRGDALGLYGIPQDKASLYKPRTSTRTATLTLRTPEAGYLDRQGLYHGYRLLFGNGYLVPSMLVQFKNTQNSEAWILEVLPHGQSISNLKDLKDHYASYSLGAHFLGALFFPHQSFITQSCNLLKIGKTFLVQRKLNSQDLLESEEKISLNPFLPEMKVLPLQETLKNHLKKQKVIHFIPRWLSSLFHEEERVQALGYKDSFEIKEQTFHNLATRLQKVIDLASSPYDLSYGDMETLTQSISMVSEKQPLKGIKGISLLALNHLFFRHENSDWTEVFEILGETFEDYGPYFREQAHRLKDPSLLKVAIHKNRKISVLTFMLKGGLQAKDLGESLHEVVMSSGQRLDTSRALEWITALGKAGVSFEYKDSAGNTVLDLAFQQRKHKIIEALIETGMGADVQTYLIIDYLTTLRENQSSFSSSLNLLEFRNHRLRWQLTLASLFPLHTGQEQGERLVVKTTDGERVLSSVSVKQLWKEGKINPKHFLSFTEVSDPNQTKYGRRTVGKITQGRHSIYVKQYPELPGIEEAVGTLMRQLLGYGAPNTLLANINGTAYLFSEGIEGRPLHDYLTGHTEILWSGVSDRLDPEALSGMILLSMLTNPEDGKPDNYIVQERPDSTYQLVGIDNDHSFVPTSSTVQGKIKINVKSILFALDQMKQDLHPNLKRKFLYYNPREILEEWIKTLIQQSKQYEALFTQQEIIGHFKDHQSFLGIALHSNIVVEIYKRMSSLQQLIELEEHLSHMDILRRLHKSVYLRYQAGHENLPQADPLERFKYVDGKEYHLSKKKEFETLSTGANLLSTNLMITTKKDLFDYVNKKRGSEIHLDTVLEALKEIAEQDSLLLVEQALNQNGTKISFEHMTDPQRESFFKEMDWSKLSIAQQQALLDQMAQVSWGDPKQNLGPWRGVLTFKNCEGFTESTFLTKGFDKKMNWENLHEVRLILEGQEGKETYLKRKKAYLKIIKLCKDKQISLKIEFRNLTLSDEELDLIIEQGYLTKLILTNCQGIETPLLREKIPNLIWKNWVCLGVDFRFRMRKVIIEDLLEMNLNKLVSLESTETEKKLRMDYPCMEDLSEMNLNGQKLGSKEVREMGAFLKDRKLHMLDLGKNNMGDDAVIALASILKGSQVQQLNLEGNKIGDEGVIALASVLKDTQLQKLNLHNNGIGDEGTMALATVLKDTQVKELNLGGNRIGDDGARALVAALKGSQVHLAYEKEFGSGFLHFQGELKYAAAQVYRGSGKNEKVKKAFSEVLQGIAIQDLDLHSGGLGPQEATILSILLKDTRIQRLNLGGNQIGEGIRALAVGIKGSQVQELNLEGNKIGDEGLRALATGLKGSQIRQLYLQENNIGEEGAKALALILKDMQLHTLDLGKNKIGNKGAKALASILKGSQVQQLNLKRNNIGVDGARELAAGIKGSQVQELNLEENKIGDEGAKALAVVLNDTQLQTLNLGKNKIGDEGAKALASILKGSQIRQLYLWENSIGIEGAKALAFVLKGSQVQQVDFYENKIRDEKTRKNFTDILQGIPVQHLDFGGNNIGDEGAIMLSVIFKDKRIQELNLEKNKIGDEGAKALASILKGLQIQQLNLNGNKIGDEGLRALATGLKGTQIKHLSLSRNEIGEEGAKAFAPILKDTCLQGLDFEENHIGDEGIRALAAGLKGSQVQYLNLGENNIGDEGAIMLSVILKDTKVQQLNLRDNKIGAKGIRGLAPVLKDTQVQELNLGGNRIGDEGIRELAANLKDTGVQQLNLWWNKIGNEGIRALAAGLKGTKIKQLNLAENKIGDEGFTSLAAILKHTHIKQLDIEENQIGIEGARALAAVLKDTQVQELNLGGNQIGDEGTMALSTGLKGSQIQYLHLSDNKIGNEGIKALAASIKYIQIQHLDLSRNWIRLEVARGLAASIKGTHLQQLILGIKEGTSGYDITLGCEDIVGFLRETDKKIERIKRTLYTNEKSNGLPKGGFQGSKPKISPKPKGILPFQSSEASLNSLLKDAGLTGGKRQPVFMNDVEKARYLLEQGNPDAYPTILKIIEQSLKPRVKPKPKNLNPLFALKGALKNLEEEVDTDTLSPSSSPQEALSLMNQLSQVYPRALLPLAQSYKNVGNTQGVAEVLSRALKRQVSGTLDKIQLFNQTESQGEYALLMAENYLQGYMSPLDLDQGEQWLRRALGKDPKNPNILTQLAHVLVDKGGLEDKTVYTEIERLLSQAKQQHHVGALSLGMMIESLQNNRKIKEPLFSQAGQRYTVREQRLLRNLHQSQFGKPHFEGQDLTEGQMEALEGMSDLHTQARESILHHIELEEKDLEKASPLDKLSIEDQIFTLKQSLGQLQEKQHQEIKRLLFPKGMTTSPLLKEFYKTLAILMRQQLSLLDAIEGGLADRKEKFSERKMKEAAAYAIGQLGNLVISNIPLPASGILAKVVGKLTEMGIDKLTKAIQSKIIVHYDAEADKARQGVREVTQEYTNNTLVANGLAALYVYRLQNLIPFLTQKSLKDFATRISASVMGYLQDKQRITTPQNLTQLMVMGFYHDKGISVGEAIAKARGAHGLKKTDGSLMGYGQVFNPLIETTDGAQYQVQSHTAKKIGEGDIFLLHIVPLIEKEFLQNKRLQGTETKLQEKRLPQLSPFQVEIIKDNDDTDYARRAMEFMVSL